MCAYNLAVVSHCGNTINHMDQSRGWNVNIRTNPSVTRNQVNGVSQTTSYTDGRDNTQDRVCGACQSTKCTKKRP